MTDTEPLDLSRIDTVAACDSLLAKTRHRKQSSEAKLIKLSHRGTFTAANRELLARQIQEITQQKEALQRALDQAPETSLRAEMLATIERLTRRYDALANRRGLDPDPYIDQKRQITIKMLEQMIPYLGNCIAQVEAKRLELERMKEQS